MSRTLPFGQITGERLDLEIEFVNLSKCMVGVAGVAGVVNTSCCYNHIDVLTIYMLMQRPIWIVKVDKYASQQSPNRMV